MSDMTDKLDQLSPLQRAVYALKETRARLDELQRQQTEPIAIIGMGCRFPGGANDPDSFWQILERGVDTISEIPSERWNADDYYDPEPDTPGKTRVRNGGFLNVGIDLFDAEFFRLSPREVASMDPQQRLLLEVSWEALERAGQATSKLNGSSTGVFIGITTSDHAQRVLGEATEIDIYTATGTSLNVAAGRLSYSLGLTGPSMAIDTACSSSLVAVHQACQSLRAGECGMALAGGVNVMLSPEVAIAISKLRALAPDGRCKTFSAAADGYGRAEGCGIVVLKRLADAIADGDNILALIRGSAVNQDGRSSGLTVPNGLAQQSVIRTALKNARVRPEEISYVEAHGTGTPLGDPIELKALAAVLVRESSRPSPLMVGSVKTNLGHLEAAAGIASLIKVILAMQHRAIPPHLHLETLNPHIAGERLPLAIPTELTPWQTADTESKRLAGISSFGFSGTNAHLILEEVPVREAIPASIDRPLHLLTLSAKSPTALAALAGRFEEYLATRPSSSVADVCFSANTGRTGFERRLALPVGSTDEAREKLKMLAKGGEFSHHTPLYRQAGVVFLFTGQGSQYVNMGRQLYETQPTFRRILDRCDELLHPHWNRSLLSVLYPEPGTESPLNETAYTQPALFALEYALAELWRSWGIEPAAVMGHSVGEYVAACVAGVFRLEEALPLIARRARLMQSSGTNGEMVAVLAPIERVAAAIEPYRQQVAIAAVNGPENLVISGPGEAVRAVRETLTDDGVETRSLTVSGAFHSPEMEPILDEFEALAAGITYSPPQLPLISNLTGKPVTAEEITSANYWRRHLRGTVRFSESIETLHRQGYRLFLEIGPHNVLSGMGRRCLPPESGLWLASLKKGRQDWQQLGESCGILYERGVEVDWLGFDRDYPRQRLSLPTYPFERQRYGQDTAPSNRRRPAEPLPPLASERSSLLPEPAVVPSIDPARLFSRKLQAAGEEDRQLPLETYLMEILSRSLQIPLSKLKPEHSLNLLLDSLIAIELKRKIEIDLQITVPTVKFYEELSIGQFATFLASQLNQNSLSSHSILDRVDEEILARILKDIEMLSEAEVRDILAAETAFSSKLA